MQHALRRRLVTGMAGPRGESPGGSERPRRAPRRRWRCASRLAARGGLDAGDAVLGIGDPLVVHAEEKLAERVLDALDVAEGQVALIELPVGDALVADAGDHATDRLGVLLGERADRCLGAVGQHHDAGLLAVGTRARVAERALVGRLTALLRGLEAGPHHARPVMAREHLPDPFRKPVTVSESEAV